MRDIGIQLSQLCKHNCSNCKKDGPSPYDKMFCKHCNTFYCGPCLQDVQCIKCKSVACEPHSLKCNICPKRVCIDKPCCQEMLFCQICQVAFCNEHFEDHKKFNQKETFKLRCNFERCKITQGIGVQGIDELSKCLIHMAFIKELRLRSILTQKTMTLEMKVQRYQQVLLRSFLIQRLYTYVVN